MKYLKLFEDFSEDWDEEEEEEDEIYSTSEALNQYAKLLKSNGFDIIVPEEPSTWFLFTKDNKIGKVDYDRYGEFRFASVHKPSSKWGTGFGLGSTYEPTIARAMYAIDMLKPSWDRSKGFPEKYKSPQEYIEKHNYLEYHII